MNKLATFIAFLAACLLSGCATAAREARTPVSIKPEVSRVAEPVAKTKQAVQSASSTIKTASESTKAARAIAATAPENADLIAQFDAIEQGLAATQADLQSAILNIQESEIGVAVLQSQVNQQSAELIGISIERNKIAEEKRQVELSAAAGRQRERILTGFLIATMILAGALAAGLYLAAKPKFL